MNARNSREVSHAIFALPLNISDGISVTLLLAASVRETVWDISLMSILPFLPLSHNFPLPFLTVPHKRLQLFLPPPSASPLLFTAY